MNRIAASLASSDGWMPKPPMPNQRRVPLIGRANSTATSISADHAEQRPDQLVVAVGAVVDAHHDRQHRDAERRPHHLLGHEQIRLLEALQRDQRRGAVDHDHAGADQRQRRQEQPLVRLKLPRHTLRPLVPGAACRGAKVPRRRTRYSGCASKQSVVVSRSGNGTPASQTGAACAPSDRLPIAANRLTTAHCSLAPRHPSTHARITPALAPTSFCTSSLNCRPRSA